MAPDEPASAGPPCRRCGNVDSQQWAIQRRIDDVFAKLGEKFGDLTGRVEVQIKPETTFAQIGGLREAKSIVRSFGDRAHRSRALPQVGHHAAQGRAALRPAGHRQDAARPRARHRDGRRSSTT